MFKELSLLVIVSSLLLLSGCGSSSSSGSTGEGSSSSSSGGFSGTSSSGGEDNGGASSGSIGSNSTGSTTSSTGSTTSSTGSTTSSTGSTTSSTGSTTSSTGSTTSSTGSTTSSTGSTGGPASDISIMPLGDSITGSPGCWRALLDGNLTDNGIFADFVGSNATQQNCAHAHDYDHEGHNDLLTVDLAVSGDLSNWLDSANPDVVLMHLGSNDVEAGKSTQEILDAYTTLVLQMRDNNYRMNILVAQIIPNNCIDCTQPIIDLNAAIPTWAESLSTFQSPVIAVDQWTNFDNITDTLDGTNPNEDGDSKMASVWLDAIVNMLIPPDQPSETSFVVSHESQVTLGDTIYVRVEFAYTPAMGFPSIQVLSPSGEDLSDYYDGGSSSSTGGSSGSSTSGSSTSSTGGFNTGSSGSSSGGGGILRALHESESSYELWETGQYTVKVTWDYTPELNQTSYIEVVEQN